MRNNCDSLSEVEEGGRGDGRKGGREEGREGGWEGGKKGEERK